MTNQQLVSTALRRMPGGVSTNIRLGEGPEKLIVARAQGSRVYSVEGREYIDFVSGYGSVVLGYNFGPLTQRQAEVMGEGIGYAANNVHEIAAADRLIELFPAFDMVRLGATGSEATTAAIGLARAATKRAAVAVFRDHYHGWHGPTKMPRTVVDGGGLRGGGVDLFELPFNDSDVASAFFASMGDALAAVIFEAAMGSGGTEVTEQFLEVLHDARDRHGFVLIGDEVITGFRVGLRGAQARYQTRPDLIVYGKALGGGLPLGAIMGPRRLMNLFATGEALHAGTYNGHPLSSASADFMLQHLSQHEATVYPKLDRLGAQLKQGLRAAAESVGVPCVVNGPGALLGLTLPPAAGAGPDPKSTFHLELLNKGIRVPQGGRWFLNAAHSEDDIAAACGAVRDVFAAMVERGAFGRP